MVILRGVDPERKEMTENIDDILSKLNAPWITKEGYLDWAKFPIDSVLKQALSPKYDEFQSACRTLTSMYSAGRTEAGIFLFGLLIHNADNIIQKTAIAEALVHVQTKQAADLLFRELRLTVSSNSTRKYINSILKTLKHFPLELIEEGFEELLSDKKWSYRMKTKFKEIVEFMEHENWDLDSL